MTYAYVGTLNWGKPRAAGIYGFALDDATGALSEIDVTDLADPTFVVVSRERERLYAVTASSHFEGEPGAGLVAYAIDPASGRLTRLNHQVIPATYSSYLSLDRSGRFLFVASGFGATASVFAVEDDGSVGALTDVVRFDGGPTVQLGESPTPPIQIAAGASHPHCIRASQDNRFVIATDMPHARVHVFDFDDRDGTLSARGSVASPPDGRGYGARHFEWHPSGRFVYVVNERVDCATVFAFDGGVLEPVQTVSTLPAPFAGENFTSDVHLHSSGRFLYLNNRGHDSIAVFAVDGETGMLDPIAWEPARGSRGRSFAFTPDERLLLIANTLSDNVVGFAVDPGTGRLAHTGAVTAVPAPSAIAFFPV